MNKVCENPECENVIGDDRRADARHCSDACKREHNTLKALQAGRPSAGYDSLDRWLSRSRRRQSRGKLVA